MSAIGIDIGTSFCCVATLIKDKLQIIKNEFMELTTPSVVSFTTSGVLAGSAANEEVLSNPTNTVREIKRIIGRKYDCLLLEDIASWHVKVISIDKKPFISVHTKGEEHIFSPTEIIAFLLRHIKFTVELSTEISGVVLTVPASFNYIQRQAVKDAATICKLNVLQLINEPTSVVLAYLYRGQLNFNSTILVFDFGGGTCDVSILCLKEQVIEVKSTIGDSHLGGEDITLCLWHYCLSYFNIDSSHKEAHGLFFSCENAKIHLTSATTAIIHCGTRAMNITRTSFENIILNLLERGKQLVIRALQLANLDPQQIDHVILAGGSSRIPKLKYILSTLFEDKRISVVDPELAVAQGAAILAAKLSSTNLLLKPLNDISFKDVTSLSIGVKVASGDLSIIINRNSPIPITRTKSYRPLKSNQSRSCIEIYEGDQTKAINNRYIDQVIILNHECYGFDVEFTIDEDGILTVKVVNSVTKEPQQFRIDHRLNEGIILEMSDKIETFYQTPDL